MNRWGKRKNVREVKLVRLSPNEYRDGGYGRKHKAGKAVGLMAAAVFVLSVCVLGLYYVFDSRAEEKALQTAGTVEGNIQEAVPDEEPGSIGMFSGGQGLPAAWAVCDIKESGSSQPPAGQDVPGETDSPQIQDTPQTQEPPEDQGSLPLIAIDPGVGGEAGEAAGEGASEAWANRELADRLSGKLQELGFDTLLIGGNDAAGLTAEERTRQALDAGADMYISIQGTACKKGKSAEAGVATWYYGGSWENRRLALLLHKGAVEESGASDRGVQELEQSFSEIPFCVMGTAFWDGVQEGEDEEFREYQEKLAEGMAWGIDLFLNPRTMYLTFDDGPSKENTAAVLDILKERGIKATFFLVGENVRKNPEMARRIVEEGHTVGIHCNRHVYEELYASVDSYLEDFQEAYDTIYEATGVEAQLFRFPGGSINSYNKDVYEEIIEKMDEKGFIFYDWNASLEDAAKGTTPEKLIQTAVASTFGRKKVIMLAHDVKSDTVQCLEALIDSLPEYKMEPLTPEVEPVHF